MINNNTVSLLQRLFLLFIVFTCNHGGEDVFETFGINVLSSAQVKVSWSVAIQVSTQEITVNISAQFIGRGDCSNETGPMMQVISTPIAAGEHVLQNLNSWSRYNLTITGYNPSYYFYHVMSSVIITLEKNVPMSPVKHLEVRNLRATSAIIQWEPPDCWDREGSLVNYAMLLRPAASYVTLSLFNTTDTSYRITNLYPSSSYIIQVAYVNSIGRGPLDQLTITTLTNVGSGAEISTLTMTYSTIVLTLEPLAPDISVSAYLVTYSQNENFSSSVTARCEVNNGSSVTLTNLTPDTLYYVKVAFVSYYDVSDYGSVMQVRTLKSIALGLVSSTKNCLILKWMLPADILIAVSHYNLTLVSLTDGQLYNLQLDQSINIKVVCDLRPMTSYLVTVIASNKENIIISAATANFSTDIINPPTPPQPEVLHVTNTTITITLMPLSTTDLPLTTYQLIMKRINSGQNDLLSYITAAFNSKTLMNKTDFTIGDGRLIGGFVNRPLELGNYYSIEYIVQFNLDNKTTTAMSRINQSIYTELFDPLKARSSALILNNRNISCLNISWYVPAEFKNVITDLQLSYTREINLNITRNLKYYMLCGLSPSTTYRLSLEVRTRNGVLVTIVDSLSTVQSSPPYPESPILVNSSYNNITIIVNPVDISDPRFLVEYIVGVEKVNVSMGYDPAVHVPGNITAILWKLPARVYFIIGDGRVYKDYYNAPLLSERHYIIYYGVCSTFNNYTRCGYAPPVGPVLTAPHVFAFGQGDEDNSHTLGVILGCVLPILVVLFIIALVLFIRIRRKRGKKWKYRQKNNIISTDNLVVNDEDYNIEECWSPIQSITDIRRIKIENDIIKSQIKTKSIARVTDFESSSLNFSDEFHSLRAKPDKVTQNVAKNFMSLNRFPHLLPYDHSLVPLKPDVSSQCTYVNATFIAGYNRPSAYIAAQSPFDERTIIDFWRLIDQRTVKIVIMMTNTQENGVIKCVQYWPSGQSDQYGQFHIKVCETAEYSHYKLLQVQVTKHNDHNSKTVLIFQLTSWPEHGVSDDPTPVLNMRQHIRRLQDNDLSPLLVHCGTGMGRTGVFIALDALIEQYEAEGGVTVCNFVQSLRRDRPYMVRTFSEYVFIYDALFQHFVSGRTVIRLLDLNETLSAWTRVDPSTKQNYLEYQFKFLNKCNNRGMHSENHNHGIKYLHRFDSNRNMFLTWQQAENDSSESEFLQQPNYNRSNYETFLQDSPLAQCSLSFPFGQYKIISGHILGAHYFIPTSSAGNHLSDVFKLIFHMDIKTLVYLNDILLHLGQSNMNLGEGVTIQIEIRDTMPYCTVANVNINYRTENNSVVTKTVRLVQCKDISKIVSFSQSTAIANVLADVSNVLKGQVPQIYPVLVQCHQNTISSGLLSILLILCTKLTDFQELDVFRTLRSYSRCHQVINNFNEYKFCYEVLKEFISVHSDSTV